MSSTRAATTRKVLGSLAVFGTAAAVAGLASLSLPTTPDNTFQATTSTLPLTFSAVQRAATTR